MNGLRNLRKIPMFLTLAFLAVMNVLVYWNSHLYYRAKKAGSPEKKIEILLQAGSFYPFNDLVLYDLGKAYFELGVQNFSNTEVRGSYFKNSVKSFQRSIMINPASAGSHFNLAQSLFYRNVVAASPDASYYDEYKKAALLGGENSPVYSEVGKLFLTRWPELAAQDREFTLDVLKKIVGRKDPQQFELILNTWEMNVKDYAVIEKIFPKDAEIYRIYARFLGERSLSLENRQRFLASAEYLDFEKARNEFYAGENGLFYYQLKKSADRFQTCLDLLRKIAFYQKLVALNLVPGPEFVELQKSCLLNLAKCRLDTGASLQDVENLLRQYLSLEDKVAAITDLESYLQYRGVVAQELEKSLDDLRQLSFEIFLHVRQNRYREIITLGRLLQKSFVVVPEANKDDYIRVLEIIGDAFQKVDFLYDAGDIYRKALDIKPDNLTTLLRLRQNYDRLNDEQKVLDINKKIEEVVAPKEIDLKGAFVPKAQSFSYPLVLDGQKISLDLQFKKNREGITPLISIFFNGRVVWENYLQNEILTLNLEPTGGKNLLQVMPVNEPISLIRLAYRQAG